MSQKIAFLIFASLLNSFIEGKPASPNHVGASPRALVIEEIIDPLDAACLPRYTCPKSTFRLQEPDQILPFTDNLNNILVDGNYSFGSTELPPELLALDSGSGSGFVGSLETEAVVSEVDEDLNPYIAQTKRTCTKDQLDYCAGSPYKSATHTMCKYCGIGPKCPYYLDPSKNEMTGRKIEDPEVIEYILTLHNEVRSKIARGRCQQPKAGCMRPLQWDSELARVAQKWADQCAQVDYKGDITRKDPILVHDKHADRKIEKWENWQGTGQSIARDIAKGKAGTFDAHKLVGHWFNQILYFDPEAVKAFGNGNQCSAGIGYYTQLVWQDTTHVGCGWSQFNYRGFPDYFENFLVCNYGPSANILKQPIYDIANETCNCPCIGCNPKTGLCPPNCKFAVWGGWEPWSSCSASCGGGNRKRRRDCAESNFPPKTSAETQRLIDSYGSLDLVPRFEDENTNSTNVGNRLARGDRVSSRSLGLGFSEAESQLLRFTRQVSGLDPALCKRGDPGQGSACNKHACPTWSPWGPWSSCTKTCGGGEERRERVCQVPATSTSSASSLLLKAGETSVCQGSSVEKRPCNENKCPELSPWSEWTTCSKSCGTGDRTRTRNCILKDCPICTFGRDEKNPCGAPLFERQLCNNQSCPSITEWSPWTECSTSCGGGSQKRTRGCVKPQRQGSDNNNNDDEYYDYDVKCEEELEEVKTCNENPCPSWTPWTGWSECSLTCGGGKRTRTRKCSLPASGAAVSGSNSQKLFCPGNESETEDCNKNKCPGLGPWSPWTVCSSTCGGGDRSRTRVCSLDLTKLNNDSPDSNPCKAPLRETEKCNVEKCPSFSPWTEWSTCSTTCGGGSQKRTRECRPDSDSGPASKLFCLGESMESRVCNANNCPVWSEWSSWTVCSVTCGTGSRKQNRKCVLPDGSSAAGLFCPGESEHVEKCNENKCPVLGPWSEWSKCSLSCGGGQRVRERECGLPKRAGDNDIDNPCLEPLLERESCNTKKCPIFTEWSPWSQCSETCGGGFRQKIRQCVEQNSARGFDNPCQGPLEVIEECNKQKCPEWSPWGDWTSCSKSCSGGQRRRFRQCVDPISGKINNKLCLGNDEEREQCNTQDCPYWTEWSEWTTCTKTCGSGIRSKVRECLVPKSGNKTLCDGDSRVTEECNTNDCPVWTEWTKWTECSLTCGGGTQQRIRDCVLPKTDDLVCDGDHREVRTCNADACPVWTEWTEWTPCTASCGGGKKVKTRDCVLPKTLGLERLQLLCPGEKEVVSNCNESPCPAPSEWSDWSECSKSCGGGTRTKVRECVNQRDKDGNPCNADLIVTEDCNVNPCPEWTEWTPWTECSKSCDGGSRRKVRECLLPKTSSNETACPGPSEMTETCGESTCPTLTPWSDWTSCSKSCGGGTQRRIRDCKLPRNGVNGNPCFETLEEVRECNEKTCPVWTDWSDWTECSVSCGGGTKTKVRECLEEIGGSTLDASACQDGHRNETEDCNADPCPAFTPWSEWSECSSTCGGGKRQRARECATPTLRNGQLVCDGNAYEEEVCATNSCPQWSPWGEWSSCTVTCGGGTTTRTRTCSTETREGATTSPCGFGETSETKVCNGENCVKDHEWTEWEEWSTCSKSCGGGTTKRSRQCLIPDGRDENPEQPCPGPATVMLFCNLEDCPVSHEWTPWTSWTECSRNCGGGTRSRNRICEKLDLFKDAEKQQSSTCPGEGNVIEKCNDRPCASWSPWGSWTSCSATCGDGIRTRDRNCDVLNAEDQVLEDGNGLNSNFGLALDACEGDAQQKGICNEGDCKTDLPPECGPNDGPVTFGSFSGRPAQSLADCTWDFFGCTNRAGQWPSNKVCCQARFDACCMKIMGGKKKPGQGHEPFEKPTTPTTGTSTGTTPRPLTQPNNPPPQHQTQDPKDKIQLIDCIWNYMGCAKRNDKPDKECKEDFNVCSMIAMGMAPPPTEQAASTTTTTTTTTTRSPISDIDSPELPDFLKPDSSTTGRPLTPIQDIDLPDGFEVVMEGGHNLDSSKQEEPNEFMQCLLRLYKCQENGETRCKDVELCQKPIEPINSTSKPVEPIVSEPEETSVRPVTSSSSKPPLPNPVSSSGSSETQCVWAYFSCGRQRSQAECQKRFDACSAGKNPDNEICAEVAENPQNYLVPHPDDCTKFYSCQNLGWKGGWIAHLMDCPATTGFDVNLRICNYIKALPRCSQEKSLTLFHEVDGVAARQTRHNQDALNVPEFGYLSSDRDPEIRPVDPKTSPKSAAPEKISISFVFTFVTTLIATLLVM